MRKAKLSPASSESNNPREPGQKPSAPVPSPQILPTLDIGASLPAAAQVPSADYLDVTYTQQPPEQRAHSREMDRLKESHKQRQELALQQEGQLARTEAAVHEQEEDRLVLIRVPGG